MPLPANFPQKLLSIIQGDPWGRVWPPRPPAPASILQKDGRTYALETLKEFVTALVFYRPTGEGLDPKPFQVLPENFHIMQPSGSDTAQKYPAIAVAPSRAEYETIGLGGYVQEETVGKYAPKTVVQWQMDYIETINLEVWASSEPELRAMMAGLESAFNPVEQMYGLRFRMPEYFDQLVCFTLNGRENYVESDAGKNRRRAQLEMDMWFTIVTLINVEDMTPVVETDVDYDPQTGQRIDLSTPTTIPATSPNFPPPQLPGTRYLYPEDAADNPNRLARWIFG